MICAWVLPTDGVDIRHAAYLRLRPFSRSLFATGSEVIASTLIRTPGLGNARECELFPMRLRHARLSCVMPSATTEITMSTLKRTATSLLTGLALTFSLLATAEPPDHAKAHGWRKKNDPGYVGYTGRAWERDYGILEGNCNRKEIGTVLGAVVGGAIGSQVGDGSGRTVAIIVGSVIGATLGREIGRDLDEADRACVGHALELAKDGQRVRWLNERTGVTYVIAPTAATKKEDSCRTYRLTATRDGRSASRDGKACRGNDGTWK